MEDKKKLLPNQNLNLMDQVKEVLRSGHYAFRTEQTYCEWIKRYLKFLETTDRLLRLWSAILVS